MAEAQQPNTPREMPRYRITEKCYLNDRIYDPELQPLDQNAEPDGSGQLPRRPLVISYAGVPAYYMEPMNDAAREMAKKHKDRMQMLDPINELNIVGAAPAKN